MKELIEAVQAGDIDTVKKIVEEARNYPEIDIVNEIDLSKMTALMWACAVPDRFEIARYLLENGADANLQAAFKLTEKELKCEGVGKTALMFACSSRSKELVEMLLARGAGVFVKTSSGVSALTIAAEIGDLELVKLIYESSGRDDMALTSYAFSNAAVREKKDVMQYLYAKGVDVSQVFFEAVKCGSLDLVKFLVNDLRANVNIRDQFRLTPLMIALDNGRVDVVEFLLEKGAEITCRDLRGASVLIHAVLSENLEMVKLFIEKEIDINLCDSYGNSPLMVAISRDSLEIAKYLIASGAKNQYVDLLIRRFPISVEMKKLIKATLGIDDILMEGQYGFFRIDEESRVDINEILQLGYFEALMQRAIYRLTKTTLKTDIVSLQKYLDPHIDRLNPEIIDNIKSSIIIYLVADVLSGNLQHTLRKPAPILSDAMIDNITSIFEMRIYEVKFKKLNFTRTLELLEDKETWPEKLIAKIIAIITPLLEIQKQIQTPKAINLDTDDDSDNDWPGCEDWLEPPEGPFSKAGDCVSLDKAVMITSGRIRGVSITDSEASSYKDSYGLECFIEEVIVDITGDNAV